MCLHRVQDNESKRMQNSMDHGFVCQVSANTNLVKKQQEQKNMYVLPPLQKVTIKPANFKILKKRQIAAKFHLSRYSHLYLSKLSSGVQPKCKITS